jgi:hypothetical protein
MEFDDFSHVLSLILLNWCRRSMVFQIHEKKPWENFYFGSQWWNKTTKYNLNENQILVLSALKNCSSQATRFYKLQHSVNLRLFLKAHLANFSQTVTEGE